MRMWLSVRRETTGGKRRGVPDVALATDSALCSTGWSIRGRDVSFSYEVSHTGTSESSYVDLVRAKVMYWISFCCKTPFKSFLVKWSYEPNSFRVPLMFYT